MGLVRKKRERGEPERRMLGRDAPTVPRCESCWCVVFVVERAKGSFFWWRFFWGYRQLWRELVGWAGLGSLVRWEPAIQWQLGPGQGHSQRCQPVSTSVPRQKVGFYRPNGKILFPTIFVRGPYARCNCCKTAPCFRGASPLSCPLSGLAWQRRRPGASLTRWTLLLKTKELAIANNFPTDFLVVCVVSCRAALGLFLPSMNGS